MNVDKFIFKPLDPSKLVKSPSQPDIDVYQDLFQVIKPEENPKNKEKEEKPGNKYKYTEEDLLNEKNKGYQEGYSKGFSDAKSGAEELEKNIKLTIDNITSNLENILNKDESVIERKFKDLAKLAINIAKKIVGSTIREEPTKEIERVIKESFILLYDKPKIAIIVHNSLVENLKSKIDNVIKETKFAGEIEIRGDALVAVGNCNIEFSGGGMKLEQDKLWEEIDNIYENILS